MRCSTGIAACCDASSPHCSSLLERFANHSVLLVTSRRADLASPTSFLPWNVLAKLNHFHCDVTTALMTSHSRVRHLHHCDSSQQRRRRMRVGRCGEGEGRQWRVCVEARERQLAPLTQHHCQLFRCSSRCRGGAQAQVAVAKRHSAAPCRSRRRHLADDRGRSARGD